MSNKPHKKLDVEYIESDVQVDIKSPDSQSLLVQLMLQVVKIGLRVDENSIDSSIINKENENEKREN